MENQKNISELTVIEIKSLLYDQIMLIERAKANIATLNQEMEKRLSKPNVPSET